MQQGYSIMTSQQGITPPPTLVVPTTAICSEEGMAQNPHQQVVFMNSGQFRGNSGNFFKTNPPPAYMWPVASPGSLVFQDNRCDSRRLAENNSSLLLDYGNPAIEVKQRLDNHATDISQLLHINHPQEAGVEASFQPPISQFSSAGTDEGCFSAISDSNSGYAALTPDSILGRDHHATPTSNTASGVEASPLPSSEAMSFHSWLEKTNLQNDHYPTFSDKNDNFDTNPKKLKVTFLACRKSKKTDFSKFNKCAQIVRQGDGPPVVFVERGKEIHVLVKHDVACPAAGLTLSITTFSLTGGAKSPVFGLKTFTTDSQDGGGGNLSFVRMNNNRSTDEAAQVTYETNPSGFIQLVTPISRVAETVLCLTFPFLNSKCPSTARKDVRLQFVLLTAAGENLSTSEFQLVSCVSPSRDALRHESKIGQPHSNQRSHDDRTCSTKKRKRTISERNNDSDKPTMTKVNGKVQYMILTDDLEIWRVLNNLKKELSPLIGRRRLQQQSTREGGREGGNPQSSESVDDLLDSEESDQDNDTSLDEFLNY